MATPEAGQQTDEELAARVQAGYRAAFDVLVERYAPRLLRYGRRFTLDDAEDQVQEAFIKAYVNINSYDRRQRFSPWIYRIAHNEFIDAIRRRRREPVPFFDPDTLFPHPVSAQSADDGIHGQQLRQMLDACLDQLDVRYREPLVLRYLQDLSYQEVADVLKIPTGTVGVRLKRGLAKLKSIYESRTEPYGAAR
jgi:RNA polymerase sigma-70 factor (ECF subfamily)